MIVQNWLRSGGTLQRLQDRYAINVRRHCKYNNLVLLKYNQIDSPMADPLVQLCRGLILDEADDWRVVCHPFDKFFNWGEGHAAGIDWPSAKVQEKLDGSLCSLYWYDGQWHVSTSGSPDASGKVHSTEMTFKDLFWDTFKSQNLSVPQHKNVDFNFMFELTTPYNRVVVPHKKCSVTLIGIRNRFDGKEVPVGPFRDTNYPTVRSFPLDTIENICKSFDNIDPLSQEGYVVVDKDFHRVKVKHPGYVAIHHLKDGFSRRRILDLIRSNEGSEFLTYFPEWQGEHDTIKGAYDTLVSELESDYNRIVSSVPPVPTTVLLTPERAKAQYRKDFAQLAMKTRCSSTMFKLLDGKVKTVKEDLKNMGVDHLMDVLRIKNIVFNAE